MSLADTAEMIQIKTASSHGCTEDVLNETDVQQISDITEKGGKNNKTMTAWKIIREIFRTD